MSKLVRFVNHSLKDFFVSNAEDSCVSSRPSMNATRIRRPLSTKELMLSSTCSLS